MYLHASLGRQFGRKLWHRDIRRGLNPPDQHRQIWRKLTPTRRPALPRRLGRARPRHTRRQLYCKTRADLETPGRRSPRFSTLDLSLNAVTKLNRMWFPHACWSPSPSQHLESDFRFLGNPNSILISSAPL
jgi:hypothetical protein